MSELEVASLGVMHAGYRLAPAAMRALLEAAGSSAIFDESLLSGHEPKRASLIGVTRFEDGRLMIRDGLHRATAVMRARPGGRLAPSEYEIEDLTYDMFTEPVLENMLLAPFDPRTEVRIADWGEYRDEMLRRMREDDDPLGYCRANRHTYVEPRQPYHDSLAAFFEAVWPYREELG